MASAMSEKGYRMKHYGTALLFAGAVLLTGLTAFAQIIDRPIKFTQLAVGVTTNTTSAAVKIPSAGYKTFYGKVVGTGAITQTQAIYGDFDSDAANGVLLCTLTLNATTRADDACPPIAVNFAYYYVVTTRTTGTGAKGDVYAMY